MESRIPDGSEHQAKNSLVDSPEQAMATVDHCRAIRALLREDVAIRHSRGHCRKVG